jgi:CPA2 family monovalent cation:H+ antiporter-2
MLHETPLIATIVIGLGLAFVLGAAVQKLRVSPLVGYLLAGVAIGPYTPGFVGDQALAHELAEIGVILLMFGVGLHFSLKDLLSVRAIAVPGAIAQIAVATLLGLGLARLLGWPHGAGLVYALALSVASTVVLLRALQERRLIQSEQGRIAVGWLIVEDIVMILTLVALPALAPLLDGSTQRAAAYGWGASQIPTTLAITSAKIAAFVALMLVLGRRIIPWVLHYIAHTGSRELFRLGVLAIALGVAFGAAMLFGVSFALGAFFAGMIMSESQLSQQAAAETLPMRDAFAVLFFVSVGMLFDPSIVVRETWPVIATLAIIVIGKSLAAFAIVLAFRHPLATALTISASLAQIGEFSFILASLGVGLGLLHETGRDLILAGALLSILMNPLFFLALDRLNPRLQQREHGKASATGPPPAAVEIPVTAQQDHTVLVGYGRVGRRVGDAVRKLGAALFVIDEKDDVVKDLGTRGIEAIAGNATTLLKAANLPKARMLLIAIPDAFEAGQIVAQARAANANLLIIARAHSDAEAAHLTRLGANAVVLGEEEIADAIVAQFRSLALAPGARMGRQHSQGGI